MNFFMNDLDLLYPSLYDLQKKAKKNMPKFAFEYLDSGTGYELGLQTNRKALDSIKFMPNILQGEQKIDVTTHFMGQTYQYPFGIAPVGMSGLIWPGAEHALATLACKHKIPYCLSTVATKIPEDIGPVAGSMGWFQLYTPKDKTIRQDILKRAKNSGFQKLIVTVDVPGESRRERQRRSHITMPPVITLPILWSLLTHPRWSILTALHGTPSLKLPESYLEKKFKKR